MKKIVLLLAVIILLGSCSYYAPTGQLHIENNAVKEELAEVSDN
jgi:hypothetical protein